MYHLEIKLLGGFAAATPNGPLTFRSDKVRGLLAYLVTRPNQTVARDTLTDLFFPEQEHTRGRKNLNLLLTRLRQSLAPVQDQFPAFPLLITDYHTVQLAWDETLLRADVIEMETLHHAYETHHHEQLDACQNCLYRLRQLVTIYQGDFLGGTDLSDSPAFDEWRMWQQEHLFNMTLTALTLLTENALATNQAALAEQFARQHIQLSEWQEYPHRQLMLALARQGKFATALQQFDLFQKIVAEQLGASPSAEMRAAYQQIVNRTVGSVEKPAPQPVPTMNRSTTTGVVAAPLPQPATPFFGRTALLKELSQIVLNPTHRLITLVGAGGMGKTRLAIALAHRLEGKFAQGASFVPLAPVTNADEAVMAQVIAAAIGYVFSGNHDPITELLNNIHSQHHLLVLDNYEHLLDNTNMVHMLLEAAPQLTIMVTSRHPLELPGEHVHTVSGLELPHHESDAAAASVQLFAERASRAGSTLILNDTTLPHITRICRFLQGWPLALELAAAWINEFSLTEIENALVQHVERLHTYYRDVVDRHKSIKSVLGWSFALIKPEAQEVLARLAVFQGGWTEEAALAVVGTDASLLHHLHLHAFVERQPNGRFTMHELIRQFAQAHLSAQKRWAESHSRYYLEWLKRQMPILYGPEPIAILPRVEADLNNIRKAWHWAIQTDYTTGLGDALDGLVRFYAIKGLATTGIFDLGAAAVHVERSIPLKPPSVAKDMQVLEGRLWAEQAVFHLRIGAVEEADAAAARAWALGEHWQHAAKMSRALAVQGAIFYIRGFTQDARDMLLRGLALAREIGQPYLIVECLRRLVRPLVTTNAYLDEALEIAQGLNDSWLKNEVIQSAAGVAFYEGRLWESYGYWRESLSYSHPFANRLSIARLKNNLGDLARRFGDYEQAFIYQNSALQTFRELGDSVMEAHVLEGLSRLYWQTGQLDLSWQMIQQCEQICRRNNMTSCLGYLSCTKGRYLSATGDLKRAKAAFREAITCSSASNHPQSAMEAYAGLAEMSYEQGDWNTALAWCESILGFLAEGHVLEGFTETSWIYLTCVRVLDALGNKRARLILERAQAEIMTLAAQITYATTHQLFLAIPCNQAILNFTLTPDQSGSSGDSPLPRRYPEIAALIKKHPKAIPYMTNQAAT